MTDLILGLDAGGSKTHAWLARIADGQPVVIGKGEAGAGNPLSAGWDIATANIASAIKDAFIAAESDSQPVASVCLSVAGGDRESVRTRLIDWLRANQFGKKVRVTNDALPLLYAGCPNGEGIAVIGGRKGLVVPTRPPPP